VNDAFTLILAVLLWFVFVVIFDAHRMNHDDD
jgi:hypothetical protein